MSQISWCIEEMMRIMNGDNFPELLNTNDKIIIVRKTLGKLMNFAITLDKMIVNPEFKDILYKFENCNIDNVKFQAEHIDKMYAELHIMLFKLEEYLNLLQNIIDKRDEKAWRKHSGRISEMFLFDFHDRYCKMKPKFRLFLYNFNELEKLGIYKEHLVEFFKFDAKFKSTLK